MSLFCFGLSPDPNWFDYLRDPGIHGIASKLSLMLSTRLEKPDPYAKPSYLLPPNRSPHHTEYELSLILSYLTRTTLSPLQFSRFPTVLFEMISNYSNKSLPLRTSPKNGHNFSIIESTRKGFRISSKHGKDKSGNGISECYSTIPLRIKHSKKGSQKKSFFVKIENLSFSKSPKERGDFVIGITNLPGRVTCSNWGAYTGEFSFRVVTLDHINDYAFLPPPPMHLRL